MTIDGKTFRYSCKFWSDLVRKIEDGIQKRESDLEQANEMRAP